jgi:hypothetical protein
MISKVLSTAVTLWLKSQVEKVEELKLEISGSNRQILQGYIPKVLLLGNSAVYQGLHLRQVELQGVNIRVNLAEILKGKPLKLLEPIPVTGKVLLLATDLNASLASTLLSDGLGDVLANLLAVEEINCSSIIINDYQLSWQEIAFLDQKLTILGTIRDRLGGVNQLSISTGLQMVDSHTLLLSPLQIQGLPELEINQIQSLKIDLGQEVIIEHLDISLETLTCVGSLTIMP